MSNSEALDLALALHATPQRTGQLRARPLPVEGVTSLLRLALAQQDAVAEAADETDLPAELLVDAARFFVEQQMLVEDCEHDPWRVLGLPPGAPEYRLREHHRLLVRLVHPDRSSEWPAAFADRVNKAWRQLRRPEGRINTGPASASLPTRQGFELAPYRPSFAAPLPGLLPAAAPRLRYLPLLLVAGIVVTAAALLWLDGWVTTNYGGDSALAKDDSEQPGAAGRVDRDAGPLLSQRAGIDALPAAAPAAPRAKLEIAHRTADAGAVQGLIAFFSYLGSTWEAHQRMRASQLEAAVVEETPIALEAPQQTVSPARPAPPAVEGHPPRADTPAEAVAAPVLPVPRQTVAPRFAAASPRIALESQQASALDSPESAIDNVPAEPPNILTNQAEAQVRQLLQRFGARYREGDLLGLLELFALDANAEEGGVPSLAAEYSQVFGTTRSREIRFDGVHWVQDRGRIRGGARVEIETQAPGRAQRSISSSQIEFEVQVDGQRARIMRWVASAASGGA
jgi:hypothetical protein